MRVSRTERSTRFLTCVNGIPADIVSNSARSVKGIADGDKRSMHDIKSRHERNLYSIKRPARGPISSSTMRANENTMICGDRVILVPYKCALLTALLSQDADLSGPNMYRYAS